MESYKCCKLNARVRDLQLIQSKAKFLGNILLNVKMDINLYNLGYIFDQTVKKYRTMESLRNTLILKR